MKNNVSKTLWILVLASIMLSACGSQNMEELLSEKSWNLVSLGAEGNPELIFSGSQVTLEFDVENNKLGGNAGCNTYFAGFEISGDTLSISAAGSTMMYCEPEELMAQETAYLQALGQAHQFSIEDGQLLIQYSDGQVLIFE